MIFQRCLPAVLILVAVIQTLGQRADSGGKARYKLIDIDRVVNKSANKFMSDQHSVGLSVGIVKDGRSRTYNFGEVEKGKKNHPGEHTIYELASITKTFTGVLLAQASEEGKVKLDDDVRKYLDGSYPNLEFEGKSMNWRQLLKLLPESCSHKPPRKEKSSLTMTYGNILTAAIRIWNSKESPS